MLEGLANHERGEKRRDDVPRCFGRLAAVVRVGFGYRFTPPGLAIALEAREKEAAIVGAAETGFKEADKGKATEPQLESIDAHVSKTIPRRLAPVGRFILQ